MSEPSAPTLADRLARLERAHRRLQRIALAGLLLLATAVLIAADDAGSLQGTSFKLFDADGKVRILMTAATGLSFLDANGKARAILSVDGEGPGLVLFGDHSRAILNINRDGPALAFTGNDAVRAVFGLVQNDPGLVLFDGQQHERAQLTVHANRGAVALLGDDGTPLWQAPAARP
jgi:hypothetical protein